MLVKYIVSFVGRLLNGSPIKKFSFYQFGLGCVAMLSMLVLPNTALSQVPELAASIEPGYTTENVRALDALKPQNPASIEERSAVMVGAKLSEMQDIVTVLENEFGEEAIPLINALLEGLLYYRELDNRLVIAIKQQDGSFSLNDVFTSEALPNAGRKEVSKIRTNNRLRISLRKSVARLTLSSESSEKRLLAVQQMLGDISDDSAVLLNQALEKEQNARVISAMELAINLYGLESSDAEKRLESSQALSGRLEPEVRNGLGKLLTVNDAGEYLESDARVRASATQALEKVEGRIKFYGFVETLFFGLSLGSVLLLIGAGLAITFGVMGVINMAHGELIMLGAYSTYVVQLLMPGHIGLSILVAIPVAFLVSGFVGVLIERGVIQFLQGRPLETLLATFGISLILQQAVRSIFSPLNRQVNTPEWLSGSFDINPILSITYNRFYILIFALIVFFLLQLVMKKTSLGLQVRAVSQNRNMAKAMGIRTEWVDAMTFGLGSGIAGLAGVALSLITNVGPNLGQNYIIDSFMVVVFGGVGNLWGTLVAGFTLGISSKFLEPVTGAVLANIFTLVFIILFIQKRPKGLFPQKGRAAE